MNRRNNEADVNNIVCGVTRCVIGSKTYLIYEPTILDKIAGEEIYISKLRYAELMGVLSHEELLDYMIQHKMWSHQEQTELDALPKRIEAAKLAMYIAYENFHKRDLMKKTLESLKHKQIILLTKRERLKKESAEGVASICKNRFLICSATADVYGSKLWDSTKYGGQDTKLVDALMHKYIMARYRDEDIRLFARVEPWRSLWGIAKATNNVFGVPAINLTDEQKALVLWSRIYDSIHESTECPDDEVLEDDDLLDGWLINQHNKRDSEKKKGKGDQNDSKHKDVFLFADTPEDAARIYAMNDANARATLKQRMAALQRSGGEISESNMPDSQLAIRQKATQEAIQHAQRRG